MDDLCRCIFSLPGGKQDYSDLCPDAERPAAGNVDYAALPPSVNFRRRDGHVQTFRAGLKHASFLCRLGFSQNSDHPLAQPAASPCLLCVSKMKAKGA